MASILLVCTANICRSPMAEAVLKARHAGWGGGADRAFERIESAGTRAGPRGQAIDARAAAALLRGGLAPEKKWRSRRVQVEDFMRFDWVLAMDADNLRDLRQLCPEPQQPKLRLLLDFVPELAGQDVPDPYFGPAPGFDHVLMLIERGVQGLGEGWRSGALNR